MTASGPEIITRWLSPDAVPFSEDVACRFLKIRRSSDKFSTMQELTRELLAQLRKIIKPRYRFLIAPVAQVDLGRGTARLEGGTEFHGEGIARLLHASRWAACFALTLGEEVDREQERRSVEDFSEAYFFDGVASALADGVLAALRTELDQRARERTCEVAYRFSPGYTRWPIRDQSVLLPMLRAEEIGISLTDTYFMLPQKSLSGVFGLRECTEGPGVVG